MIVNQFKISESVHLPWEESWRDTLCGLHALLKCKHRHEDKQPHNAQDASCGWIHFWGFSPCALYSWAKTRKREDGRAHVTEVSLDEKTCLSLRSQVVIHCAVILQKFTDFKSLDIVPSITGHWCHGPIWGSLNTFQYMQSKSEQSKHIPSTSLTPSLFP